MPETLLEDYVLSVAARFWNIPPYELEQRSDSVFWIQRAMTFKSAENEAEKLMMQQAEADAKKNRGK